MTIWFDMDGTIADFYGVENWLDYLMREDTTPYEIARPLLYMSSLARKLNELQSRGYTIGIVSWTSRGGSVEYCEQIAIAKRNWLTTHLKSVKFDHIDIIEYGTPKHIGRNGILFDDEERNRTNWGEGAYDVHNIMEILKSL